MITRYRGLPGMNESLCVSHDEFAVAQYRILQSFQFNLSDPVYEHEQIIPLEKNIIFIFWVSTFNKSHVNSMWLELTFHWEFSSIFCCCDFPFLYFRVESSIRKLYEMEWNISNNSDGKKSELFEKINQDEETLRVKGSSDD